MTGKCSDSKGRQQLMSASEGPHRQSTVPGTEMECARRAALGPPTRRHLGGRADDEEFWPA